MRLGLITMTAVSVLLLSGCASLHPDSEPVSPAPAVEVMQTTFVPSVVGLNGEQAAEMLSRSGLNFIFLVNGASVSPTATMSVLSQDIPAGYEVASMATVTVEAMEPTAPAPVEPEPAPAPVEPIPEPVPVEPAPEPVPAPAPVDPAPAPLPPYENCDAVKAAGDAPIYPDNPRWSSKFDGDNDGVGCDK